MTKKRRKTDEELQIEKNPEKDKQAVAMYIEGVPVDEICKFLHIGPNRLYDAIDAVKIPRRTRRNIKKASDKQIKEAVRLYVEGMKISLIVVTTSVSRSALFNVLKCKGITQRGKDSRSANGKKRRAQTTTNISMLQKTYGEDFAGLCNKVLSGELDFHI